MFQEVKDYSGLGLVNPQLSKLLSACSEEAS